MGRIWSVLVLIAIVVWFIASVSYAQESKVPRCDPPGYDNLIFKTQESKKECTPSQTSGETSVQPKARFATPQEPHNTISSEWPNGWRPPVKHYDDSDFYIDPSKPHLRFYGKKENPKRTAPVSGPVTIPVASSSQLTVTEILLVSPGGKTARLRLNDEGELYIAK